MKYMITLYHDAKSIAGRPDPDAFAKLGAEYERFTQSVRATGSFVDGNPLKTEVKTVRQSNGKAVAADGPSHASPEGMVGYYILELPSMTAAVEAASRIPAAKLGSVEIREFMDM